MIVCIAEKPSVARDIARLLGANDSREGYMEGNGYQVTWTFGHLCELKYPEDYTADWKRWSLGALPMIPARFGIRLKQERGIARQFAVIRRLMQNAESVINCGDAGQEGELIQRWVMQKAGVRCPVRRLWISSLTEEAIREGFAHLRPQEEYDLLYKAGLCRAIGDWLLGMNATRLYTLKYGHRERGVPPLSIGRVQTPTLALIVRRQFDIEHFRPETYWVLTTVYRETTFTALAATPANDAGTPASVMGKSASIIENSTSIIENSTSNIGNPADDAGKAETDSGASGGHGERRNAFATEAEGLAALSRIRTAPFTVLSVERKNGSEAPPRLFDLTSLQVECNKKFGYSAEQTLQIIQGLYEKKVTTYPRVDTTYLSDDIYSRCKGILNGIAPQYAPLLLPLRGAALRKRRKVFDSSKVTDHHAIIPTGVPAANLTDVERNVYDLVARRFIAVFYPDCRFATTVVAGRAADVDFRASGKQIIDPGWRTAMQPSGHDEERTSRTERPDEDEERTLPDFVEGESGAHEPGLAKKNTQPPKPYTEATLLRAMETAGRTVEDEELRDALKENGIGRPSTRAAIIETLFRRNYIRRQRKALVATPTGVELIGLIREELLKSAELTGLWEKKLRGIERRSYDAARFLDELKTMVTDLVRQVLADNENRRLAAPSAPPSALPPKLRAATDVPDGKPKVRRLRAGSPCPECGQGKVVKGKTAYGCSRWKEGCTFRKPFRR